MQIIKYIILGTLFFLALLILDTFTVYLSWKMYRLHVLGVVHPPLTFTEGEPIGTCKGSSQTFR